MNLNGVRGVACLPSMKTGFTDVKTLMSRSDANSWALDWSQLEVLSLNVWHLGWMAGRLISAVTINHSTSFLPFRVIYVAHSMVSNRDNLERAYWKRWSLKNPGLLLLLLEWYEIWHCPSMMGVVLCDVPWFFPVMQQRFTGQWDLEEIFTESTFYKEMGYAKEGCSPVEVEVEKIRQSTLQGRSKFWMKKALFP